MSVGDLVKALADGVGERLGEIKSDLEAARKKITDLGDDARAINGLGNDCAGWASHLSTVCEEIAKEQREVPAKLLGNPIREIVSNVDTAHAERVKDARK